MSVTAALLLLFVVMPVLLALVIATLVQRRSAPVDPAHRTSALLRDAPGEPGRLLRWNASGSSFLDRRPMVAFVIALDSGDGDEVVVTQSLPRSSLRALEADMRVRVHRSPDGVAAALSFPASEG